MNIDLLRELCEIPGVPGREERVRSYIEDEIDGLFDEVETDPLGSLICRRAATGKGRSRRDPPTVLIAAHMDEIGFYVRHVDNNGFLWVNPAGGFDSRNLFSRRVLVCTSKGDYVGVMNPGGKPIHISSAEERKKVPETSEFFIDLGMPAAKVKKLAKIGDFGMSGQLASSFSRLASWVGTAAYMSPERIKGESYAYPSDIWSFAIVALEGACGAFPYPAFGNYFEVVKRIVDGPLPTEDPAVQVRGT